MNLGLKGAKIALAGASRGLGLAIAGAFVEEGAEVWLTGRNRADLEAASQRFHGAPFSVCDLETDEGRGAFEKDVASRWGKIDGLILNIGSGRASHRGFDTPEAEWTRVMGLNFLSHAALIRLFKPRLEGSKLASIVGVSSIAGMTRLAAPVSYSAAKAALNQLCISSAAELAEVGIRYNLVAPGNILAPGGRWEELIRQNPEQVKNYIETSVPMKRFATPEEVASFVVFLASEKAAFCTGTVVRVDGGQAPSV